MPAVADFMGLAERVRKLGSLTIRTRYSARWTLSRLGWLSHPLRFPQQLAHGREQLGRGERLGQRGDIPGNRWVAVGVDVKNGQLRSMFADLGHQVSAVHSVDVGVENEESNAVKGLAEFLGGLTVMRLEHTVSCHS